MARTQSHGIATWGKGRPGVYRAVLHFAVLDARGQKPEVGDSLARADRPRSTRQRRT